MCTVVCWFWLLLAYICALQSRRSRVYKKRRINVVGESTSIDEAIMNAAMLLCEKISEVGMQLI